MRIKFLVSRRNMGCVGHRREPSKQKGNLDFLRVCAIDEKREPLSIVDWTKSFPALNLIASVRPSETEFVRIGPGSECLIKRPGSFDFMNSNPVVGVRKVNKNRIKRFAILCLPRATNFALKSAGCRHSDMDSHMAEYAFYEAKRSLAVIKNSTVFQGLLLLVSEIEFAPLFSHQPEKAPPT